MSKHVFIILKVMLSMFFVALVACPKLSLRPFSDLDKEKGISGGVQANIAKIPPGMKKIPAGAYKNGGYTGVDFSQVSNTLKEIGENAFTGNKIKELTLPNSVTVIGANAFQGNPIAVLSVNQAKSLLTSIGASAFEGAKLSEVVIPDKVTKIGGAAFKNNPLGDVILGAGLKSAQAIGVDAFKPNDISAPITLKLRSALDSGYTSSSGAGVAGIFGKQVQVNSAIDTSVTDTNKAIENSVTNFNNAASKRQELTHAITFMVNSQPWYKTFITSSKDTITKPTTDPKRDGYAFTKWTIDKGGKTPFVFTTKITGDMTLYAQWQNEQPRVTNISLNTPKNGASYGKGENIEVIVSFSEKVKVDVAGGKPTIGLKIGSATKQATYTRGDGTDKLVFEYEVKQGDVDTDRVEVLQNSLAVPPKSNIKDIQGPSVAFIKGSRKVKHLKIPADKKHKIVAVFRTITLHPNGGTVKKNVTTTYKVLDGTVFDKSKIKNLSFDAPLGKEFLEWRQQGASSVFDFSKRVTKDITLYTQWKDKKYTVKFDMNGGSNVPSIKSQEVVHDGVLTEPTQKLRRVGYTFTKWTVDKGGKTPFVFTTKITGDMTLYAQWQNEQPRVTNISLNTPKNGASYGKGENIEVIVSFSEKVKVDAAGGKPTIGLKIGSATKQATYTRGDGTDKLVFEYEVKQGDVDTDGVEVLQNSLAVPPKSNIEDIQGASVNFTKIVVGNTVAYVKHPKVAADIHHKVNGGKLKGTINFDKIKADVGVKNTPDIVFTDKGDGDGALSAQYVSGGDAFTWDYDPKRKKQITFKPKRGANAPGKGVYRYTVDKAASTTHGAVSGVTVTIHVKDNVPPTLAKTNSIVISSSTGKNKTYVLYDEIEITLSFSEKVQVTDNLTIDLKIGNKTRQATHYSTGTSSTTLVFRYQVKSDDKDDDGIEIVANSLTLLSKTSVKDDAGNAIMVINGSTKVQHGGLGPQINHKVDWLQIKQYTVKFNVDGKEDIIPPKKVNDGEDITLPPPYKQNEYDIRKSNKGFKGWFDKPQGGNKLSFSSTQITKDMVLYAQWVKRIVDTKFMFADKNNELVTGAWLDKDTSDATWVKDKKVKGGSNGVGLKVTAQKDKGFWLSPDSSSSGAIIYKAIWIRGATIDKVLTIPYEDSEYIELLSDTKGGVFTITATKKAAGKYKEAKASYTLWVMIPGAVLVFPKDGDVTTSGTGTYTLATTTKSGEKVTVANAANGDTFTVAFTPAVADDKGAITYKSSDDKVATVDNKGVVTIVDASKLSVGAVTITATKAEWEQYKESAAKYTLGQ